MSEVLARSLRPVRLSQIFGQESLVKAVKQQYATRKPRCWMFVGAPGCGKTTIARIIATSYQCSHGEWGEPCDACIALGSKLYSEINASHISGVDELRPIADSSFFKPTGYPYRIIFVDEAQKISNAAQNLLLKPLEEPPATTVWILGTSDPAKLSAAIKRRPVTFTLKGLSVGNTEKFITSSAKRGNIKVPLDGFTEKILNAGISSPGVILAALELLGSGLSPLEAVAGVETTINSLALCKAVTAGSFKGVQKEMAPAGADESRWLRASVAGWLRGVLARESDPKKQEQAAISILELCTPPLDDATMRDWLLATLFKITRRYRIQ